MKVRVKLFAAFREIVGKKDLIMDMSEGSTVEDVVAKLLAEHPKLRKLRETMIYSVNKEYAKPHKELSDGDEVGILPPISGG
ncbi:MAG: MoaD/ThiS family protein [Thermoplasmata archaeon]